MKHREAWTVTEVTQHVLQHLHCSTQLFPIALRTGILFCAHRCATDHNMDNTTGMLQEWLAAVGSDYATVVWKPEEEARWLTEGKWVLMENSHSPGHSPQSMPRRGPSLKRASHLSPFQVLPR